MCGIAGLVNLTHEPAQRAVLEAMADIQRHRGPDDKGLFIFKNAGLSHVRLSIIDLSKDAAQPMPNEDRTVFVIHNGEIYNYLELRKMLAEKGHIFRSKSDTEVILHAYEEWGEGCLNRFNGMWAFAILDVKRRELFLARDRFGVKPCYIYRDSDIFLFASEIKAILVHPKIETKPNDKAIHTYLRSGYGYMDTSDETFFEGILQLPPAHHMTVSLADGTVTTCRYWSLEERHAEPVSDDRALAMFEELFESAVRLRLRSDVPLGISLSGGLDSTSIACVASRFLCTGPLNAFSSCFDDPDFDERQFMQPVIEKTGAKAHFVFTQPDELLKEMKTIIWHQDEPYSTLSILPQWNVMKKAKAEGVKVLLAGQGGDEVMGGYHKYYLYFFADLVRMLRWADVMREVALYRKNGDGRKGITGAIAKILVSYAVPDRVKRVSARACLDHTPAYLKKEFARAHRRAVFTERRFGSILNNDLYNALRISPLPSLLHVDDRSGMAHAVESRAPFLDYRLVEFMFSLGPEFKIRDGMTKYTLRAAMKGILPETVRLRRDKMGFVTPLEKWLKADLRHDVRDILSSREFSSRPYFDRTHTLSAFGDFTNGKGSCTAYTIWSWINLELWARVFIDGAKKKDPMSCQM